MSGIGLLVVMVTVGIGAVIAVGVWHKYAAWREARVFGGVILPLWAAQGPFENGVQSAEAMRYAWLAVSGDANKVNLMSGVFHRHAQSFDADPDRWEETRRAAIQDVRPNVARYVAQVQRLRAPDANRLGRVGILTLAYMVRRSEQCIARAMNSDEEKSRDVSLRELDSNPQWFEAWRLLHYEILQCVASSSTGQEQVVNLRRELVKLIDSATIARWFVLVNVAEEDKRLIAAKLHPEMAFDDVMAMEGRGYVFEEASICCLRQISFELGDARKNDWFEFYCDTYSRYIENLYKEMTAQARDDIYDELGLLVPQPS